MAQLLRTYDGLKSEVAAWLSREGDPFFEQLFELWVQFTHVNLRMRLRTRDMQATAILQGSTGRTAVDLPLDFAGLRGEPQLVGQHGSAGLQVISSAFPWGDISLTGGVGAPRYYFIYGPQIFVFPRPDAAYQIEIAYFRRLTWLTVDLNVNFIMREHPDLYFFGILFYAYLSLDDFAQAREWRDKFHNGIADLANFDTFERYGTKGMRAISPAVPNDAPLSRRRR
jgi:hypothetical protein